MIRCLNPGKTFRYNIFLNYRVKLIVSILFVNSLMLLVLTSNRIYLTRAFIIERAKNRINSIGLIISGEISENLWEKDTSGLRALIKISVEQ
ncbi:MAG: hypothetical protein ABIA63_14525, partial [bacterium]